MDSCSLSPNSSHLQSISAEIAHPHRPLQHKEHRGKAESPIQPQLELDSYMLHTYTLHFVLRDEKKMYLYLLHSNHSVISVFYAHAHKHGRAQGRAKVARATAHLPSLAEQPLWRKEK